MWFEVNKLDMAHEYAVIMLKAKYDGLVEFNDSCHMAKCAFDLADAMQAEADKRKEKGVPDVLKRCNSTELEWQPDWSLAPSGFDWWAIDGFSGQAYWYRDKPFVDSEQKEWDIQIVNKGEYKVAPSFNYQGDWKDSLRKRPDL